MVYKRSRILHLLLILAVISTGLASRRFSDTLPHWIGNYAGDVLWAMMIFLIIGFIFSSWPTARVGLSSIIFSFAVEASQLYHSPWIDVIRRTHIGGLVLGYGFLWSDLICYSIGVAIGMLFERLIIRNKVVEKG